MKMNPLITRAKKTEKYLRVNNRAQIIEQQNTHKNWCAKIVKHVLNTTIKIITTTTRRRSTKC